MAFKLAFLDHAEAMKGEDVLEPPSGNTTSREDRQVRDKKTGAAGKTAPVEGATPGLAGLSQGSWWKTKAKLLWVFNGVKKSFFLLFFVLFCFFSSACPHSSSPFSFPTVLQELV